MLDSCVTSVAFLETWSKPWALQLACIAGCKVNSWGFASKDKVSKDGASRGSLGEQTGEVVGVDGVDCVWGAVSGDRSNIWFRGDEFKKPVVFDISDIPQF